MPLHDENDKDWQEFFNPEAAYPIGRNAVLDYCGLTGLITDKQLIKVALEKLTKSNNLQKSDELEALRGLGPIFVKFSIDDPDFADLQAEYLLLRHFAGLDI